MVDELGSLMQGASSQFAESLRQADAMAEERGFRQATLGLEDRKLALQAKDAEAAREDRRLQMTLEANRHAADSARAEANDARQYELALRESSARRDAEVSAANRDMLRLGLESKRTESDIGLQGAQRESITFGTERGKRMLSLEEQQAEASLKKLEEETRALVQSNLTNAEMQSPEMLAIEKQLKRAQARATRLASTRDEINLVSETAKMFEEVLGEDLFGKKVDAKVKETMAAAALSPEMAQIFSGDQAKAMAYVTAMGAGAAKMIHDSGDASGRKALPEILGAINEFNELLANPNFESPNASTVMAGAIDKLMKLRREAAPPASDAGDLTPEQKRRIVFGLRPDATSAEVNKNSGFVKAYGREADRDVVLRGVAVKIDDPSWAGVLRDDPKLAERALTHFLRENESQLSTFAKDPGATAKAFTRWLTGRVSDVGGVGSPTPTMNAVDIRAEALKRYIAWRDKQ